MGLDDANSFPDLHRCSALPVQATASPAVAGLCVDSRSDAIEWLLKNLLTVRMVIIRVGNFTKFSVCVFHVFILAYHRACIIVFLHVYVFVSCFNFFFMYRVSIGVAWVKILRGPNSGAAKILVWGNPTKIFYKNLKNSI